MKTVRRLAVEIDKRRVEWSMSLSELQPSAGGEHPAEVCPRCGSPWMLLNRTTLSGREYVFQDLQASLASRNLHVLGTPSGQIWICRNSFEQLKENI